MWRRGDVFWHWADPTLHHRTYDEILENGCNIQVQVRLSRTGETQLFIGIYAREGQCLHEESHDRLPGKNMSRALVWGVAKAREMAPLLTGGSPLPLAHVTAAPKT
ncbi:hypothetical protein [Pseudomonas sp. SMV7]|uniref:hypothetical protein n=1 Tax=Pseudomonas sp. SMV7 TaxID=3390194 RepID=UPI003F82B493